MNQAHKGVGALITNTERSHYYIQQKDETYPIKKWRGAYSFWGGALETSDASEEVGLLRELEEELNWQPSSAFHKIGNFMVESDHNFPITVFEILLSPIELNKLAAHTIPTEGNGIYIAKEQLLSSPWVWDLDKVLRQYLEMELFKK